MQNHSETKDLSAKEDLSAKGKLLNVFLHRICLGSNKIEVYVLMYNLAYKSKLIQTLIEDRLKLYQKLDEKKVDPSILKDGKSTEIKKQSDPREYNYHENFSLGAEEFYPTSVNEMSCLLFELFINNEKKFDERLADHVYKPCVIENFLSILDYFLIDISTEFLEKCITRATLINDIDCLTNEYKSLIIHMKKYDKTSYLIIPMYKFADEKFTEIFKA
jgi:hypothetical protein